MKNRKIKISELKVSSFVTNIHSESAVTIKGGSDFAHCQDTTLISVEGGICEGSCPSYMYITFERNEHGVAVGCV